MSKQLSSVSRRGVLQTAGAFIAGGMAGKLRTLAAPLAGAQTAGGSARVLALVGDRFSNSDYIQVSLDRLFRELDMPVDYVSYKEFSPSSLGSYQLFVCLRDGMIWPGGYLGPDAYTDYARFLERGSEYQRGLGQPGNPSQAPKGWITDEQGKAIADFVSSGKGFYALHNSSNISLFSKSYRDVMGGAYIGHPPLRPFKVRVTNKNHPITRDVNDFIVNDEQHFVDYDKSPDNIFLKAENIDGLTFGEHGTTSISGWAHEYGKGRVVFTAVGHDIPAMWQSEYLKIQKNAVRWLLKTT